SSGVHSGSALPGFMIISFRSSCRSGCRINDGIGSGPFGFVVLDPPAVALVDGRADDVDIARAVGVIELDDLPPIPRLTGFVRRGRGVLVGVGHVDPGSGKDLAHDCGTVGPMISEGLAGPAPGDQGAATAVAEVLPTMGLAAAVASGDLAVSALGLDAVAEPVRALRRARQDTDLRVQPVK